MDTPNKPKLPDRSGGIKITPSLLRKAVDAYKESKDFGERINKRTEELKKILVDNVKEHGVADDRGHKWLAAGDVQLKHERRVSTGFDLQAAIEWVNSLNAWDSVKEVVETTSEDLILKFAWENGYQDVVSKFYTERETWAFKLVEGKSYNDE